LSAFVGLLIVCFQIDYTPQSELKTLSLGCSDEVILCTIITSRQPNSHCTEFHQVRRLSVIQVCGVVAI